MALSQTIIGKETLPDGRVLEYGKKDPTTGQRFERIINAPTPQPTLETIRAGITQAKETFAGIKEKVTEFEVPAEEIAIGTAEIPVPIGGTGVNTDAFNKGLQAELEATKKQYQDALQAERDRLAKEKAEAETKISDLEDKQSVLMETDIKPQLEPFREKLEKSERERLKVEENYFANQKSVGELESLLTSGQAEIENIKNTPGLSAIKTGQINKKQEDISARAGVLQAVMSARNNQISVAYTLIDRTVQAITNDRKDQLTYYQAVYDMYENQKDTAGKKLITLEADEKNYIKQQISDLKEQADLSQETVNMVKEAMLNPETATVYEQAGVKLTDTPEQIRKKLADYSYQQEAIEINNKMADDGYKFLATPELAALKESDPNVEVVRMKDSKGKEYAFWREKKTETAPTSYREWELAGKPGTYKDWLNRKETAETSMTSYLANQGIPLTVATDSGELTKSALNKIVENGVSLDLANYLWENMRAGNSFELIRQGMRSEGIDTAYLDKFVQALQGETEEVENPFK